MSLLAQFTDRIADLYAIPAADRTATPQVDATGADILGTHLPTPGTFDLRALIDGATVVQAVDQHTVDVVSAGQVWRLVRLSMHGILQFDGVHELVGEMAQVFMGSFGASQAEPTLDSCKELLLGIAVFDPLTPQIVGRSWRDILQAVGPVVAHPANARTPVERLARIGLSPLPKQGFKPKFADPSLTRMLTPRNGIPREALDAFTGFFGTTDGSDVAILRLYRIFELEFARTIQNEIQVAPLAKVWSLIQSTMGRTELQLLRKTYDRFPRAMQYFNARHFEDLFGVGHRPQRDTYSGIAKWLDSGSQVPPPSCNAQIVYYVRCALVHSKIIEGEPFLFPPFSAQQDGALVALVDDILLFVEDLLFV